MNKEISLKALILSLATVLILSLSACSAPTDGTEPPDNTEYRIEYIDLDFVTDADKEAWRQPLIALLSKLHVGFYTVELDPDAEAPEDRYEMRVGGSYIALMDLNSDGIPEVLEGYSGRVPYYVAYDLMSGETIGDLSASGWCCYFNTDSGVFEAYSTSFSQMGVSASSVQLLKAEYSADASIGDTVKDLTLFSFSEIMDQNVTITLDDGRQISGYSTVYEVNGNKSDMFGYYSAMTEFLTTHVLIPGTRISPIVWDDVSSDEEAQEIRAKKMADALLSSDQKFIASEKN